MHLEHKKRRNIETIHPKNQPADPSGTSADGAGPGNHGSEFQAIGGKLRGFSRPVFVITGVALCMGLASCVVPYDSQGGGSVSLTNHRPGYQVNSLPGGYRSELISGSTYYYHDGHYYRPESSGYVVVDAPRNSRYYDDYSRLNRTHQTNRGYRESSGRLDPRSDRGEFISRLPDGHRVVNHGGNTYYQSGDQYYRRQGQTYVTTSSPY